jgi:hypothetical protein
MAIGLKDDPLEAKTEESLGFAAYADALAQFILKCDTPITISIQGDWGSGKTSLMQMIKAQLLEKRNLVVDILWFNTWLYSQFGQSGNLPLSLLTQFINKLSPDEEKRREKRKMLTGLVKTSAVVVGGLVGQGESVQQAIDTFSGDGPDIAGTIEKAHQELSGLVKAKLDASSANARIVVFVDDLDRLVPEHAVELLEAIKLFLDIPGCVFVLACDYQVVMQGLVQKFRMDPNDLKGRSFFDKIIQVPFQMPTHQYQVENYFKQLLERMNFPRNDADVRLYVELARFSIGFNPRTIKRIFNSLQLLELVLNSKKELLAQLERDARREWQRILFGTLCLQQAYPALFHFLCRESLDQALFSELGEIETLRGSERFAGLLRELDDREEQLLDRVAAFMNAFTEAIQLKSDPNRTLLSPQELSVVTSLLSFSSVVSTEKATGSKTTREAFLAVCSEGERAYFTTLLDYLHREGLFRVWGVTGFSIRDNTGKAIFFCYPTECTRDVALIYDGLTPAQQARADAFLQRYGIDRPAGAKMVYFKTDRVPIDALIAVIEEIRDPAVLEGAPA